MWIIIDTKDVDKRGRGRVVGTLQGSIPPPCPKPADRYEVKEWIGSEPLVYEPISGVGDYDPTVDDVQYEILRLARIDVGRLKGQLDNEIEWLGDTIPQVDSMTLIELRGVLKRMLRENRDMLRAWRYVISKELIYKKGGE